VDSEAAGSAKAVAAVPTENMFTTQKIISHRHPEPNT